MKIIKLQKIMIKITIIITVKKEVKEGEIIEKNI